MSMAVPYHSFYFQWELALMEFLQARLAPGLLKALSELSFLGESVLLVLVLGWIYWCYDKEFGRRVGLQIIMGLVWNTMIKNVVLRRRPYFESDRIDLLKKIDAEADACDMAAQGYSFPSAHSQGAVSLYGSIALHDRRRAVTALALVLVFLTGASRVAAGAHYPTDVLAGWGFGLFLLFFVPWLERRLPDRRIFYGVLILSALPGLFYCGTEDYFSSLGLLLGFVPAMVFEEKYVRFYKPRSLQRALARFAGGLAGFLVLNALLKGAFSLLVPAESGPAAHAVRALRYALLLFALLGIYPLAFDRPGKDRPEEKRDGKEPAA